MYMGNVASDPFKCQLSNTVNFLISFVSCRLTGCLSEMVLTSKRHKGVIMNIQSYRAIS